MFQNNQLQKIITTSQDVLIQIPVSGLEVMYQQEKIQILKPGEVDRRVLGWDLTWAFLSVFVNEVIGLNGLRPLEKQQTNTPGEIIYCGKGGDIWAEKNEFLNSISCTFIYKEGAKWKPKSAFPG